MFELELENTRATLVNLNTSTEKNGPDIKPYCALRISVVLTPDQLAFFTPDLKGFLYDTTAPKDLAEGMPLRDKHMGYPLKRDEEMNGATLTIDYGLATKMILPDAKCKAFELTPMEGGSIIVPFTVICHPDPDKHLPTLYRFQGMGITISLEPGDAGGNDDE